MQSAQRLLTCVVLFAGCSPGGPSESLRLSRTFERFPELAEFVGQAVELKLYEGLPHPDAERDLYASELAKRETVEIDGHRFYEEPLNVAPATLSDLRRLCSTQSFYRATIPDVAKACGAYHPDWCLIWRRGSQSRRIHFCFGCRDVKAYAQGQLLLRCEMREKEPFAAALGPLQANRPKDSPAEQ